MREALKNLFRNEIILEDGNKYFYSVNPFELKNALGYAVAVLHEYSFSKDGDGIFSVKLYRTEDGNWYDIEESKIEGGKNIIRLLKSAIDSKENKSVLE